MRTAKLMVCLLKCFSERVKTFMVPGPIFLCVGNMRANECVLGLVVHHHISVILYQFCIRCHALSLHEQCLANIDTFRFLVNLSDIARIHVVVPRQYDEFRNLLVVIFQI